MEQGFGPEGVAFGEAEALRGGCVASGQRAQKGEAEMGAVESGWRGDGGGRLAGASADDLGRRDGQRADWGAMQAAGGGGGGLEKGEDRVAGGDDGRSLHRGGMT